MFCMHKAEAEQVLNYCLSHESSMILRQLWEILESFHHVVIVI